MVTLSPSLSIPLFLPLFFSCLLLPSFPPLSSSSLFSPKALFRPMTVMKPDLVLICENMLMAQGFVTAKVLASKFYGLYSLLEDLLSKQLHYDWGLRAVKSVLVVAGGYDL